jgi:hypothetical protein
MNQNDRLRIVRSATRNAEEIADADVDCHPHAADGPTQNNAFVMKFDMPDAAVGTGVVRVEADGKRVGVEP